MYVCVCLSVAEVGVMPICPASTEQRSINLTGETGVPKMGRVSRVLQRETEIGTSQMTIFELLHSFLSHKDRLKLEL